MGFELDVLQNNDKTFVVLNNTTGRVISFKDYEDLLNSMFDVWKINKDNIYYHFERDEIQEFFDFNGIEIEEEELNNYMI